MSKITAHTLATLLREKHKDDLFFSEISCGHDVFEASCGNARLDHWAMKKSWSNPNYIGYEVKVSRADFMQDTKWPIYLNSCTQFYFVVAPDVCDVSEIGEQAGLMVVSKNGKRLVTKKKAPRLKPKRERIYNMMKLALMRQGDGIPQIDKLNQHPHQILDYLENAQEDKIVGSRVAHQLKHTRDLLDRRETQLQADKKKSEELLRIARELGISEHDLAYIPERAKETLLKRMEGYLPELRGLAEMLGVNANRLRAAQEKIDKFLGGKDD